MAAICSTYFENRIDRPACRALARTHRNHIVKPVIKAAYAITAKRWMHIWRGSAFEYTGMFR
jgi:hypothetical protein